MTVLRGLGVSAGVAAGPAVRMPEPVGEPPSAPEPADREEEVTRLAPAVQQVVADLLRRAQSAEGETREVLEATAAIAEDPAMIELAEQHVRDDGMPAARALWQAANTFRDMLAAAGGYVGARAADVEDIRNRIVAALMGQPMPGVPDPGRPFVLFARDLAPADTATISPERVLGLVTVEGGPTSHTSILARALGIPAVVGCRDALAVSEGVTVVIDGTAGTVDTEPAQTAVADAQAGTAQRHTSTWTGSGATADGRRVQLLANIGDARSSRAAAEAGAEGVGLFRTEFLFLDSANEPSPDAQRKAYAEVFEAFPGKKVVARTLDAGADKPLPFLDQGEEPNPALGVRGLRVGLARPEVLERQLVALAEAAASSPADVWVMAPMVAVAEEAATFAAAARRAGLDTVGVMVEIPSAALTASAVLAEVDFASLGTNDLAQYVMAADRLVGALAPLNDPWQPALLRLVQICAAAGQEAGKPVGVCGEAAADPALAAVLVGFGVTSLSMSPRAIPEVGGLLARTTYDECRQLADMALAAASARAGRDAVLARLN